MTITGHFFIGKTATASAETFRAFDPVNDVALEPGFSISTTADAARASALAGAAFPAFREAPLAVRASLLERIAANIEAAGDALIGRAMAETGLPRARLEGERARTTNQLRLFADVVRRGDWIGARLDPALPERKPLPRPDLRLRKIAIGPVAVFGASNFPLAFSVAGGDTAAALAAGCPVVFKGHPAHPGVSEIVARAILAAAAAEPLPDGVFSLLSGPANELGAALAADQHIAAVAFTGSRSGGRALTAIAQARETPIPVFAEMSAVNPVLLLPNALAARAEAIAQGFAASLTQGAGQFCTNPGLVIAIESPALDRFIAAAVEILAKHEGAAMLTPRIHHAYVSGLEKLAQSGAETLVRGGVGGANCGRAALFAAPARAFLADPELAAENFGASGLMVRCANEEELFDVVASLEGQLTSTLHLEPADHQLASRLLPILETKAGRILANGWPTGVEVSHAMVHGGPFPATSDARSTSVGTLAIERFLRPVCYQDIPAALLPPALAEDNPLGLRRLIDGRWS
ncbi:MAG TPA: aldehyde dehydrogenase (NADP(+)) [Caulobacterales bacterium]|nr:aldehyde dehydrogenase (NADP(+)) [Caulobacterales bacterium]